MSAIVRVSVVPDRNGNQHRLSVESDKAWYSLCLKPNDSVSDLLKIIAIELIHIADAIEGGEQTYD